MQVDLSLISFPIGGAIIGYITNWLAIKMLFRPYNEKRILGLKVPFTPGLIPKERERIAKAIGEVVGNHLLTSDVIVKELTSKKMDENIKKYVDSILFEKENKININHLLISYLKVDVEDERIKNFFVGKIVDGLGKEETKEALSRIVSDQIIDILKRTKLSDQEKVISNIIEFIVKAEETNDFLKVELKKLINRDVTFTELMTESVVNNLKSAVNYNEPQIKMAVKELIVKEEVKEAITKMISEVIESKLGAIGAMFANPESIYDSIVDTVYNKIEEIELTKYINDYADVLLNKQIYEVIPENSIDSIMSEIANRILSDKTMAHLKEYILNSEQSLLYLLEKATNDKTENMIYDFILAEIDRFITALMNNNKLINRFYIKIIDYLLKEPILISDQQTESIHEKVNKTYNQLVVNNASRIIKNTKVMELVETQINSFEIEMLEDIILNIAKKELAAITWLGALLGFIMSFFIVLIR